MATISIKQCLQKAPLLYFEEALSTTNVFLQGLGKLRNKHIMGEGNEKAK